MRSPLLSSIALFALLGPTAHADEAVDAVWKPQTAEFTYIGVTTHYSCNGIEVQAEKLLREMGARNVKADIRPCFPNQIHSMYKVELSYEMLSEAPDDATDTVKALSEEIVINDRFLGGFNDNHCELVERFARYALPDTNFKPVSGKVHCNANRSRLSGELKLQVLRPADDAKNG